MKNIAQDTCVVIRSDADIVKARQIGRAQALTLGFSTTDATLVATAISELARNIVRYAGQGEVLLRALNHRERSGIAVIARDSGPGIKDVKLAMQRGFSTSGSLGLGLPGVRRLVDEFDIESEYGKGTVVTIRKWVTR